MAAGDQGKRRRRGVMLILHAGRRRRGILREQMQDGIGHRDAAADPPDILRGDGAGAQDLRDLPEQRNDGGFHPHGTVVRFHHGIHQTPEVVDAVAVGSGAGAAAAVGAGRRQRHPGRPDNGASHRMRGHPHGDALQPAGGGKRHPLRTGQHHGKRPGPEGIGQQGGGGRRRGHQLREHFAVGNVDDHGVIGGAALGGIHCPHRFGVAGVGGQAVHRFGGDSDKPPLPQQLGGTAHAFGILLRIIYFDQLCFFHHAGFSLLCSFSACSCASSGSTSRSKSPPSTASSR